MLSDFLKYYLSNRSLFVSLNNIRSNVQAIFCKVPQGSVLGLLLFSFHVCKSVHVSGKYKLVLLADDTHIL